MVFAGLILVASLILPPQADPDLTAIQAELERCGVDPAPITYDDLILGYMTIIPGPGPADEVVDCLGSSTKLDLLDIQFVDVERYERLGRAVMGRPDIIARMEAFEAMQTQWLADRDLLADLPRFEAGDDMAAFAVAIEEHCGVEPGSVLVAQDNRVSLQLADGPPSYARAECALNALGAAGVELAIGVAIVGEADQ